MPEDAVPLSDDSQVRTTMPAAVEEGERTTIARLTADVVPMLITRLTESELGELEVREQGWRVRLRRPSELNGQGSDAASARSPAQPQGHRSGTHHEQRVTPREQRRDAITSPAVGYFTPRDDVQAGKGVRKGDGIGHVDVLGVRVEVVAETDGTLAKLDVERGQAVEYGQPIAHLEPASATRAPDV